MVPVDLRELLDPLLSLAVMRGRVKPSVDAGLRVDTARNVSPHLEREHPSNVRRERCRLQVEHQLDVLIERVRHTDGRIG